jgi:trimeric autotransporter adhesin
VEPVNPLAPVDFTFQWRLNQLDVPGAKNQVMVLTNLSLRYEGAYTVEVNNFAGTTVSPPVLLDFKEPVLLLAELENRTVIAGESVSFTVGAVGTAPLEYTWTRNGVLIPGQTSAKLSLTQASVADSGEYRVEISNSFNSVSSAAFLTVVERPVILSQPSQTIVLAGDSVLLEVAVSGSLPLAYQWRFNGVDIPGATASSFALESAQLSHAGNYTVMVSNAGGLVVSDFHGLTVQSALRWLRHPSSQSAPAGGMVQFSGIATGAELLSYQWLFNGEDLPGATGPVLNLSQVTSAQEGSYQLLVSDPMESLLSAEAILTVQTAPVILEQPAGQTLAAGAELVLKVEASGSGLRYQWRRDGLDLPGATGALLRIREAQPGDSGSYVVSISNEPGSILSLAADVVVHQLVSITEQPWDVAVCLGGTMRLSVQANGALPFTYQWHFNGNEISGATNAVLVLEDAVSAQSGNYQVRVSNPVSSVSSRPARVTVIDDETLRIVSIRRLMYGAAHLTFSGPMGQTVHLQGSTDLIHWTVLTTFTFESNCHEYVDQEAAELDFRFYKIAPPSLTILGLQKGAGGSATLEVDGQDGMRCLIQVSDDLEIWTDLGTALIINGQIQFTDAEAEHKAYRFYQVFILP